MPTATQPTHTPPLPTADRCLEEKEEGEECGEGIRWEGGREEEAVGGTERGVEKRSRRRRSQVGGG